MASSIYQQSIDKQRIIVTGEQSSLITRLVRHVLASNQRKFDFVPTGQSEPTLTDAPVLILETKDQLTDYHHHILLLAGNPTTGLKELEMAADTTPKGGIIIYPEANKDLKTLATRERPDVQAIPFNTYKHEKQQGKTILITSTNEKFPIALNTDSELSSISAARELLKKIGISSGQFYRAVSNFQP
ncbi:MAG: peptidoglycan synthetase [Bacteroidetes bacterium OLB12]|nr:MAG: peptidoglycan synthetase [Bacteroidetes bacterium OLB12]